MLLDVQECQLVLMDYQTRLMPAMLDAQPVLANALRLAEVAALMAVPVIATEQSARAVSTFSFAEIEAGPRELSVVAWSSGGAVIDRAVIARR